MWHIRLPTIAVIVPTATPSGELETLRSRLERLFRRTQSTSGNKTVGLREGTDIKIISFAPEQLNTTTIDESKRDAILLAFGIPPSLVYKATSLAEIDRRYMMTLEGIRGDVDAYLDVINSDPDIMGQGVELYNDYTKLEAYQKSELEKATSLQVLVGSPIMTVNEARERLELPPLTTADMTPTPQPEPQSEMMSDNSNDEVRAEEKRFRAWFKNRKHKINTVEDLATYANEFKSTLLPLPKRYEIAHDIIGGGVADDAPFQDYP